MAGFLAERDSTARELMDDPACDPDALRRTYDRFALVNAAVSGQRAVYRKWIRPRLRRDRALRLLDIGTGGGDLPRRVLRWARRDGMRVEAVGIDPDARSIGFAREQPEMPGLRFEQADSRAVSETGERFDVVVSNHVLHHLDDAARDALLADSERLLLPGGVAVHGDIERSRLAYAAFAAATWPLQGTLLRGTFIRPDGLTSIRRCATASEMAAALPPGWRVRRAFPSRLEAIHEAL
ncbi:methyltransferase domain-containing protein [Microbacterium sp. NPDC096154]|uniref:methyltransferase domain-containing protein n=1 Tax=Microbacterium sp. NPDC096154 TaxID=3155549 RepID=UPI00331F5FAE